MFKKRTINNKSKGTINRYTWLSMKKTKRKCHKKVKRLCVAIADIIKLYLIMLMNTEALILSKALLRILIEVLGFKIN